MKSVSEIRRYIENGPLKEELKNALMLYNDALDCSNYEIAYIKLWSALELLTGTEPGDSYDKTIKRAAFIYQDLETHKASLGLLRQFRNNLVHRGHMNAKLEIFVYDLKLYVEQMFRFIVYSHSKFGSFSDIGYFLDCVTDLKELDRQRNLLNLARDFNKKRKGFEA